MLSTSSQLPASLCAVSPEGEQWAEELMAAAKTKRDLPALAGGLAGSCNSCRLSLGLCVRAATHRAAAQQPAAHTNPIDTIKHVSAPVADPHVLLMDDTSLENTFTCQPQQRNMHGRIFGGFLMRCACT